MNTAEDKIRAALRETALQIPSHSLPPLRLPQPGRRRRLLRRRPRGRHLPVWAAPLGVAATVGAVVVGSFTAAHVIGGNAAPAGHHRMTRVPTPARVDGLPPYFIRWTGPARVGTRRVRVAGKVRLIPVWTGTRIAIYSSATGRAVATATMPGREGGLAAGGEETFFAAQQFLCAGPDRSSLPCRRTGRTWPEVIILYRITLTAAGAQVQPLPIRPVPGIALAISATADGRKLAILRIMATAPGHPAGTALTVASAVTGQERNWTTTRPGPSPGLTLVSWLADGRRVAFLWARPGRSSRPVVHLLDTGVPGAGLLAGVTLVPPERAALAAAQAISPDGSTVIATAPGRPGLVGPGAIPGWSVVSFRAGTGRPVRVVFAAGPHAQGRYWNCLPLWVSRTGQRVLIRCGYHPAGGGSQHRVFLAGPGRTLRRLPWLEPSADTFTLGLMRQG